MKTKIYNGNNELIKEFDYVVPLNEGNHIIIDDGQEGYLVITLIEFDFINKEYNIWVE